jgi:demethylmenaquinone methyltransferase/2-methoxy-6-polyprenyl-1,4-benzoquinol methylase
MTANEHKKDLPHSSAGPSPLILRPSYGRMNPFFDPGAGRGARVNELFSRIAARYDLINDLQSFGLHRYWKHRLLGLAKAQGGKIALDLCCGTGDLAFGLGHRGARVVGVDFTGGMLEIAQHRAKTASAAGGRVVPEFVRADALRLPFPDGQFDIITIAYGLRNLADLTGGLGEIRRVLKPGGRLLVLDFGQPSNALWRAVYLGYLKRFVPILGRLLAGSADAYSYILESLRHYPGQEGVAAQLRQLGYEKVRVVNLLGGVMGIDYAEKPGPE